MIMSSYNILRIEVKTYMQSKMEGKSLMENMELLLTIKQIITKKIDH